MRRMEALTGKDEIRHRKPENDPSQSSPDYQSISPSSELYSNNQSPTTKRQNGILQAQQTHGNQAVQRMLASETLTDPNARRPPLILNAATSAPASTSDSGLSRVVVDEETGEETSDLMRPTSSSTVANSVQRDPPTGPDAGAGPVPAAPAPAVVTFPTIGTITADATVEAERAADWTAGVSDFKERAGWVMWNRTANTFSVVGKVTGTEDGVNPGATPADSGDNFMVGHYHQHPPLRPGRNSANFPVGPSGADTNFANNRNSPGVVRDFTDRTRATVTNYTYGPNRRT